MSVTLESENIEGVDQWWDVASCSGEVKGGGGVTQDMLGSESSESSTS